MKQFLKYTFLIFCLGTVVSCGGDDDICESGEGTPRMKVKFRNAGGQLRTVDSLYLRVDYGTRIVNFGKTTNADSLLIPLRVDDFEYTDLYFKTRRNNPESKVRVNYTTTSSYVSPGCGIKKTYQNVNSQLVTPGVVTSAENGQNFIENEDKTNLFLTF
ncbi:DUF6452 family protein [Chryseobacterium sp. Leaf394]|uniref:DUF6452 family protein n=1 Tax=Chryseobacterium sp. Leaf394 TaxID=1736361 RepID=UPI0006F5B7F8|nr:DUF6452 family protein [Chryseobacterium sp. Leaf394]KQS94251.1 hypothetical protein ASG21_18625 [Chryseobacterium sp. Leaf394]